MEKFWTWFGRVDNLLGVVTAGGGVVHSTLAAESAVAGIGEAGTARAGLRGVVRIARGGEVFSAGGIGLVASADKRIHQDFGRNIPARAGLADAD